MYYYIIVYYHCCTTKRKYCRQSLLLFLFNLYWKRRNCIVIRFYPCARKHDFYLKLLEKDIFLLPFPQPHEFRNLQISSIEQHKLIIYDRSTVKSFIQFTPPERISHIYNIVYLVVCTHIRQLCNERLIFECLNKTSIIYYTRALNKYEKLYFLSVTFGSSKW